MKITKHVYFYPCAGESLARPSNTVIITGKDKQIMIDPGIDLQGRLDALIAKTKKDGLNINQTDEIWLTHAHIDHYGMVYNLFARFEKQRLVRCHPMGKPMINDPKLKQTFFFKEARRYIKYGALRNGKKINAATKQMTWGMAKKEISSLFQKEDIINIEPFFDREIIDVFPIKAQVVFLPGHTPDEIGFWIPKEKVLILGDLINIVEHKDGEVIYKLVLNTSQSDLDQALESLKKMKQIKERKIIKKQVPEILFTAHSAPVRGKENVQKAFDQLISKANNYKALARNFVRENPGLKGDKLIKKLAETLSMDTVLDTEKRLVAKLVLKALGAIK